MLSKDKPKYIFISSSTGRAYERTQLTRRMMKISVGQALLILIDMNHKNEEKLNFLKRLYLSGAKNLDDKKMIAKLMEDESLANYEILYSKRAIDEDPTRRYFETHLAFETLKTSLDTIDISDLTAYKNTLYNMLPCGKEKIAVDYVMSGSTPPGKKDNIYKEYSDAIKKLQSNDYYQNFAQNEKLKLELLIKLSFLAIINDLESNLHFPIDIYQTGIFSEENRGKLFKPYQDTVRSQHLGLMKSYMPVPINDVAHSDSNSSAPTPQLAAKSSANPFLYLRPADQAYFKSKSEWPRQNFEKWVHPFSNSISGTMLVQLRVLKYLQNESRAAFTNLEKTLNYIKCFSSILLYNSGGHSFHEFLSVLSVPEVKESFGFDNINEETLLLDSNRKAFEQSLMDTIAYNKTILVRQLSRKGLKCWHFFAMTGQKMVDYQDKYEFKYSKITFDSILKHLPEEKCWRFIQKFNKDQLRKMIPNSHILVIVLSFLKNDKDKVDFIAILGKGKLDLLIREYADLLHVLSDTITFDCVLKEMSQEKVFSLIQILEMAQLDALIPDSDTCAKFLSVMTEEYQEKFLHILGKDKINSLITDYNDFYRVFSKLKLRSDNHKNFLSLLGKDKIFPMILDKWELGYLLSPVRQEQKKNFLDFMGDDKIMSLKT